MDADVAAAAQISQTDIIERQAESIARLKRQVQKGVEYKQLTKSKLKEAAVRLKEYRVRVETLLGEVETLKKQVKDENRRHETTKKQFKNALQQQVKATKPKSTASTQTLTPHMVTRPSQTLLSGHVEQVNKMEAMDTLTVKKRARERGVATFQEEKDQFLPKLSRNSPKDTRETPFSKEPLHIGSRTFLQETSAALDAQLALSNSEDEGDEPIDILQVESGLEGQAAGLSRTVLDEIEKELEMRSNDEDHGSGAAVVSSNGHLLLGGVDQAVFIDIEKKLGSSEKDKDHRRTGAAQAGDCTDSGRIGTSYGVAVGENSGPSAGFDFAISDAIDKDLESSSDEEDCVNVSNFTNAKRADQTDAAREDVVRVSQRKCPMVSIDDELDDEFAALDADSDTENHGKAVSSSSSGSSSENDSSDSSDSDCDDNGGDIVAGELDYVADNESLAPGKEKDKLKKTALQAKKDSEPEAPLRLPIDKDAIVLTTSVKKTFVGVSEDAYSAVVDAELTLQSPKLIQLNTGAELTFAKEKNPSSIAADSQPSPVQKNVPRCIQPSGDVINDAGDTAVPDTQTSPNDTTSSKVPELKQAALVTSSSSSTPSAALELDPSMSLKQSSDHALLDFPVAPIDSDKQSAETDRTNEHASSVLRATIGRFRKADEANLEGSKAPSQKKIKLNNNSGEAEAGTGMATPQTKSSTADRKKKSTVAAEAKTELLLKKSLSTFKQVVMLVTDEEPDNVYVRRTITVLVNQCSKLIDPHLDHVITLCRTLADAYLNLKISPMLVVRGSLGLFRTPRSRRLMQESKMGVSWLCNQVLTRVVCSSKEELEQHGSAAPKSLFLSNVDECLLHLRGFLVEERANIGESLSENRMQVQVRTRQNKLSHDKVFLAHICALHTHLCRSTGQLVRSRVLLFDLVRDNPNIRGLYFAMVMLEIYPAILERKFDQHCIEREVLLKETLQQALVVISGVAAVKQERLLRQSSVTMLHAIVNAIQMPELEEVDGSGFSFRCACVEKLFTKVVILCQLSKSEQQVDEVRSPASTDYFALAKSMEICTAVYGVELVMKIFNIEQCLELYSKADIEDKIGIMHLVGHIAMGIASSGMDTPSSQTKSEEYIESVTNWMCDILSTDKYPSPDDRFRLTFACSTMCVELILEYAAPARLEYRRRVLCAVVSWFDAMSSNQLINLPATFLRRLRLAVVAARPQVIPR